MVHYSTLCIHCGMSETHNNPLYVCVYERILLDTKSQQVREDRQGEEEGLGKGEGGRVRRRGWEREREAG